MAKDADDRSMSLGDHLEELRWRLLIGLAGPVIAGLVMLLFSEELIAWLSRPLLVELAARGYDPSLHPMSPTSSFTIWLKVGMLSGLVIGLPWLIYQVWRFIAPGLHWSERKFVVFLMPGSAGLATAGVLFMYYIMLPVTLWFLVGFMDKFPMPSLEPGAVQQRLINRADPDADAAAPPGLQVPVRQTDPAAPAEGELWINSGDGALRAFWDGQLHEVQLHARTRLLTPVFQPEAYLSFVLWLGVAFAVSFQLPLVMLMLAFTGLVDRAQMARVRPYALLGCAIIAAILTPPDPMSQLALAIPMYVLYELGLLAVLVLVRKRGAAT